MNGSIFGKRKFFALSAVAFAVAAALSACDTTTTTGKTLTGVEFTDTPAPSTNADMVSATTTSSAIYHYSDGSSVEYPLSYNVLYKNTDKVGLSANEAARLYDVSGNALLDANGDPVVAETPDANSFLTAGGKPYLVTHYEYDWKLADNSGSPSRMPMSMTVTELSQNASSGALTAVSQAPVDFSAVDGLWIPCAGGPSPWNTHLGSEEDYDLYFVNSDGTPGTSTSAGLTAMTEKYFNSATSANPYDYGYIPEVTVAADGSSSVVKHYSMGRGTWELTRVMPDNRTAYFGDDGTNVGLFMYVADTAADLSAGTLYAAKWTQTSADNGGAATLTWVKLGHATDAEVKAIIDAGTVFTDVFDITTPALTPTWAADGYKAIRAGQSSTEYLRLKAGKEQAAAFLESRRYAAYLGATTEFNKMEGVAVNAQDKVVYLAMSYIDKGMKTDATGPVDDIQLAKINAGATYALTLSSGQNDTDANPIDSAWVATAMSVPAALLGEDITVDALGNTANPAKVANPDNLFFSDKMRTLFIGEDSGTHVNNFIWAYNVDSGKLSRILSQPSGAEATGLVVHENLNGHAYIGANNQHQGEWLGSMPTAVRDALIAEATTLYGVNAHSTLNYYLEANVGYIGGMPGL
jgi:secreted PhoX family phosphatase